MNSFGKALRVTTFGESHGAGIGCVIDGLPANLKVDYAKIKEWLDRRKPGQNKYSTSRKEKEEFEILSGVFEGFTTGTPLAIYIANSDHKSSDYGSIKDLFRPGHADATYFYKYGIRDYRGGGRSSARESVARVAAAGVASLMLEELNIVVKSGVSSVGNVDGKKYDFNHAKTSEIFSLDKSAEGAQKDKILEAKNSHDSVGGTVVISILNAPKGLGEPLYDKLDSRLAEVMMGINGAKGVEIGLGVNSSKVFGSKNNDLMDKSGFITNNAGGILGGISSGAEILVKVHFKPTPSIFHEQKTLDKDGNEVVCKLKGRHDPCIAIRGSVVAEAMAVLTIADMLLLNLGSKVEHLKKIYG